MKRRPGNFRRARSGFGFVLVHTDRNGPLVRTLRFLGSTVASISDVGLYGLCRQRLHEVPIPPHARQATMASLRASLLRIRQNSLPANGMNRALPLTNDACHRDHRGLKVIMGSYNFDTQKSDPSFRI